MKSFLSMSAGPLLLLLNLAVSARGDRRDDKIASRRMYKHCEWGTYMCCWTGFDGPNGMTDNTDVCRVPNYPEKGEHLEMPSESEGSVYCHGFTWSESADVYDDILPLYQYVTNAEFADEGDYFGNVEGAPECGCIEEMPQVSYSDCSRYDGEEFSGCGSEGLLTEYSDTLGEIYGPIHDINLVGRCGNDQVPDHDFSTCEYNTYMCCWTDREGGSVVDNTDVCRVLDYPSMGEALEFPGDSEGAVHCHGMVWPDDATDNYIHILAQKMESLAHMNVRGYYGNIEGAPMCGCIEDMPEVSSADCTRYDEKDNVASDFLACFKNDLRLRYYTVFPDGKDGKDLVNLVGECDNA